MELGGEFQKELDALIDAHKALFEKVVASLGSASSVMATMYALHSILSRVEFEAIDRIYGEAVSGLRGGEGPDDGKKD